MEEGHWRRVEMIDFEKEDIKALRNAVWIILKP